MILYLTRDDFTSPIVETSEPGVFSTLTEITTGEILNLDPTQPAQLSLWIRGLSASEGPSIIIQQETKQIESYPGRTENQTLTVDLDPELPLTFSIHGWRQDSILTARLTVEAVPEGPQRLKVLAWLPNPRHRTAVLGTAILGGFFLPVEGALPVAFTLGVSRLGAALLPSGLGFHTWQPLTPDATAVTIERGITHNGISGQADLGVLSMRLFEPNHPRAIGLRRGTPIIAIDAATRSRIFTGTLNKAPQLTRSPLGARAYEIEAVDTLATLAAIKRYQLTPTAGYWWTWRDVLSELLDKHAISWRTLEAAEPGIQLGPTANELSLTGYLDMYLATNAVTWWIDRYNRVTAARTLPGDPAAIITDRHLTAPPLPVLEHVAEAVTWDTASIISTIEIRNNGIELDESGEVRTTQTELTVRNDTLAATYGETTASIETAALIAEDLHALGEELLTMYEPSPIISSARFTPHKGTHRDEAELDTITRLDLLDAIETRALGETALTNITAISHSITPTSWQTSLTLTERKPA